LSKLYILILSFSGEFIIFIDGDDFIKPNYLEELYQTVIDADLEGDTFFPATFDWTPFNLLEEKTIKSDEKNPYDFTIKHFERKDC